MQNVMQNTTLPRAFSHGITNRLSPAETRRRLWHMSLGLIPVALGFLEWDRPISWWFRLSVLVLAVVLTAVTIIFYAVIRRSNETRWVLNVVETPVVPIVLLLAFPWHPELAAVVMAVIAFGDGSATLFGILFGRQALPWNPAKTWVGFLSFGLCATPLAALVYWLSAVPSVSWAVALQCGFAASVAGQFAESIPKNGNDNLFLSIAAGTGLLIAHTAALGWP